ncbi:MAG: rhomboid family intramembrane serine protease [Bacteroidetes bacterium]|nr:rhomboid family intramembrane serine protease [Bacteroidota bacterium]
MNFQSLPVVTKNILIINIAMYIATWLMEHQGVDLTHTLGLHYISAPDFRPYQFITYMFMHGSLMHIFFNMYAVFMFGALLEQVFGPKRFLIYYLFTGLGAAAIQLLVYYYQLSPFMAQTNELLAQASDYMTQTSIVEQRDEYLNRFVVVGASGSLFGLLIAFGILFPNSELYLFFVPVPIKAKYFVAGYGAIELFSGFTNNPGDNVAHFAHIGGMIFGFILLMIWRYKRIV